MPCEDPNDPSCQIEDPKESEQNNQNGGKKVSRKPYEKCTVAELKQKATKKGIKGLAKLNKADLIKALRQK